MLSLFDRVQREKLRFRSQFFRQHFAAQARKHVAAVFSAVLLGVTVVLLVRSNGDQSVVAATIDQFRLEIVAFLIATCVWLALEAVGAWLAAGNSIEELGVCDHNRFVLKEPMTISVLPTCPGYGKATLTIDSFPRNWRFRGSLSSSNRNARAIVQSIDVAWGNWRENDWWPDLATPMICGAKTNGTNKIWVEWEMPSNALPGELRIQATALEFSDTTAPVDLDWYVFVNAAGHDLYLEPPDKAAGH